jgi:hypothetical protein
MRMRTTFILLFTASFWIASDSLARTDSGARKLTPKAAEVVKKARQYEASASHVVVGSSAAMAATDGQGSPAGADQRATNSTSARRTRVVVRPDGSLRAYLGEEHMTDLVAVKHASGGVSTTCATDADPKALEGKLRAEIR